MWDAYDHVLCTTRPGAKNTVVNVLVHCEHDHDMAFEYIATNTM